MKEKGETRRRKKRNSAAQVHSRDRRKKQAKRSI
jgi:hypothetical protein